MGTPRPARDLSGEESLRTTEVVEVDGGGVDTVQVGKRVHKVRGDARRLCRLA